LNAREIQHRKVQNIQRGYYAVPGLFFRVKLVGWALALKVYDRPTVIKISVGQSYFLTLRPVGRSQNFGRTKSIIDSSIFHTKERAVNRVVGKKYMTTYFEDTSG